MLTVTSSALALLAPLPLVVLIDNVIGRRRVTGLIASLPGAGSRSHLLIWVVAAGLVIFALTSIVEAVITWLWIRVGQAMVFDLANDVYAATLRRSLLFHTRNEVGDSMSRVTGDSWAVHTVAETLVFQPLHALLTIAAVVFVMWRLDVSLTLLSIAVVPLMVAGAATFGARMRAAARGRRDTESRIHSLVQQTLSGIPVVQAFAQEDRQRLAFRELASADIHWQKRSALLIGLNSFGSGVAVTLGTGLVMWAGAHAVLRHALTVGELLLFLAYLAQLQEQLKGLTNIYSTLQLGSANVDRVLEVLGADREVVDGPGAVVLSGVRGDVVFEGVSFGYEPGSLVLEGVSVSVRAGEVLAIVGATGAGKSTLVSLVPRFFDPVAGRVLVDGCDVRGVSVRSLRSQVSVVLQESFLFPMTIAQNIAYGRPDASRAEIEAAAAAANVDGFVAGLPDGFETVVGERGATLSGGERQRVAIARALLKDAPILVLDEPTSALDAVTEVELLEALRRLMVGRTTLVIAHRLSTIRDADRIV
ncbi:MAG: transporter related, partial [Actinomycetia bacterium]|nr:transporter related [Actinomycetes bacterium]